MGTLRLVGALALLAVAACTGTATTATPPATSASVAPTTTETDGPVAGACGTERWAVKTGTDGGAAGVNVAAVSDNTVEALREIPAPSQEDLSFHGFDRLAPVELTVYRLDATLVEFKREADSDYHLVIADGQGRTMIAEIPLPSCVGTTSPFRAQIAQARQAFDAHYPHAETQASFQKAGGPVTLTGVGFFDFQHGQTGVAPNAIELHPVLSIAFG